MIGEIARFALTVGSTLWDEWRSRRAAERAAKRWAETIATPRGCPRCRELNYVPGAVRCRSCNAELPR